MENKICPICSKKFYGRIDKKYCSLECKNELSNAKFRKNNERYRRINRILKNNHKILEKLSGGKTKKVTKTTLTHAGFDFAYFTNDFMNSRGERYLFCYNLGYLFLEDEMVLIVCKKG